MGFIWVNFHPTWKTQESAIIFGSWAQLVSGAFKLLEINVATCLFSSYSR